MTVSDIVRLQKRRACEDTHKRSSTQTVQTQMSARQSKTHQGHYTPMPWIGKCKKGNVVVSFGTLNWHGPRKTVEHQENLQSGHPVSGTRTEPGMCKT